MRGHLGAGRQEASSSAHQYTIRRRVLWIDFDHITFKGNGKESFSFNRVLVENLIETFETMQDIYSDNYRLKVYTGNCIIQLNANPKDPSESFFDIYDRDEMKLIYGIKISILKEMFII